MRLVTMKPTSVIIMDTHPIIRMSIEVLLQKNSELQNFIYIPSISFIDSTSVYNRLLYLRH
ncbi:hypothetical protein D9J54_11605 [Escherichia coli]|nr:hypothetical protein [Escherichia coli]